MATGRDLVKKALSLDYYKGAVGSAFAAIDVAQIASADNKTKALLTTLKDLAAFNLFGWAGMIAGSLFAIRGGIKAAIMDSGSLQKALENLSRVRLYEAQFAPFVKGAGAARQRLSELMALAGKPFNLGALVSASRSMEVFTRGAYSSDAALRVVVGSSARAGQAVEDVGGRVGQLYAELRDGAPIGSTAAELERMGVISAQTGRELEQMQQRGASVSEAFGLVTAEMQRAGNAGDQASDSVEALGAKYEETKTKLNQAFTENFLSSQVEGTKNTIAVMEQLEPVAASVGRALGGVITYGENFMSWIGRAATAVPGLSTAAGAMTRTLIVLGTVMAGVAAVRWISFLREAIPYAISFTRSAIAMTGALRTQGAASLGNVRASLANAAANRAQAMGANESTVATIRAAGGARVATVAIEAETVATTEAAAATSMFTKVLVAAPWGWIILGISLLIGVLSELQASTDENEKALQELAETGADVVNKLQEQARAMKDLDDQQDALAESTRELVAARQKLAELETTNASPELVEQAKVNVRNLETTQRQIGERTGLQPTRGFQQILEQRAQQQLAMHDAEFQSRMSLASPGQQMILRQQRVNEEAGKVAAGKSYQDNEEAAKQAELPLQAKLNTASQSINGLDTRLGISGTEEERAAQRAALREGLEKKQRESEFLEKARYSGPRSAAQMDANDFRKPLFTENDQSQLNLLDRQRGYVGERNQAQEDFRNVRLKNPDDIVSGYAQADSDARRANTLPKGEREALMADVAKRRNALDVKRLDVTDPNRAAQLEQMKTEQIAAQRQMDANKIDLSTQKQIADLRMRGMDAAEKESAIRIDGLRQQLALQTYLDDQGKAALENRIAEEQKNLEMMREAARIQREADEAHLRLVDLDRRSVDATVAAQFGLAAQLRDRINAEGDAQNNRESYNQKVNSGQYSADQARAAVGKEQREREAQRASERQNFLTESNRQLEEQRLQQSRNPADRLKAREMGDQDTARGRIAEALKRNATPQEAASYAQRGGVLDLQKELQNNGRSVIADSLQRVGGGGGVGGLDPSQELARRRTDLMQSINDMLRDLVKKPDGPPPPMTF